MVDYSKWDNIELSDDSDVEVHPNVDKKSFIRWKQRDIHEKRMQRQQQIKGLRVQKEMYKQLTKRALYLLTEFKGDLSNDEERNKDLDAHFDAKERCTLEDNPDTPCYNEMLEDLFIQLREDLNKDKQVVTNDSMRVRLEYHQEKINKVTAEIDPKILELENQDKEKITSEDYKEGWNSSFINKRGASTVAVPASNSTASNSTASNPTASSKQQSIEIINDVEDEVPKTSDVHKENYLDEMNVAKTTLKFSELNSFEESKNYILKNPNFVTHQQKDALLMSCFDLILKNETKLAVKKITQAIIIQWVAPMINGSMSNPEEAMFAQMPLKSKLEYVSKFFSQLQNENGPLRQKFDEDVERMVTHIKQRCEIIKNEEQNELDPSNKEGVEQIQLKSLDPDTKLKVNIPGEGTDEFKIFETLPLDMQNAIKIGSIDAVNEVFSKMEISEAEKVLEKFNESGVISIQALLENEEEFEELKGQLHDDNDEQQTNLNTNDIVD